MLYTFSRNVCHTKELRLESVNVILPFLFLISIELQNDILNKLGFIYLLNDKITFSALI